MAENNNQRLVKFQVGTSQQYRSISPSPNQFTFYYTTDDQKVYLGSIELTTEIYSGRAVEWDANPNLIGKRNCIYVYTDYITKQDGTLIPGLKIGDGQAYLIDTPFIDQQYLEHVQNQVIHITQREREFWNNKVSIDQKPEFLVDEENLVFKIN